MRGSRRWAVALSGLLALGFVACGDGEPEQETTMQTDDEQGGSSPIASRADLELALVNVATAQESYVVDSGLYTESIKDLEAEGAEIPDGVEVIVAIVDGGRYFCLEALSADGSLLMSLEASGTPQESPCAPREPDY